MKFLTRTLALLSVLVAPLFADTVERALPTANVNASTNRSNVAWAAAGTPGYNPGVLVSDGVRFYTTLGDTFSVSTSFTTALTLTSLKLWVVDTGDAPVSGSDYYLYLGTTDTSYTTAVYGTSSIVATTYSNGQGYYNDVLKAYQSIYELTFNFAFDFSSTQTVTFALAGFNSNGFFSPYVLASNSALSGSTQASANGSVSMYFNTNPDAANLFQYGAFDSGASGKWDKSTDLNFSATYSVTSIPTPVPEPSTYGLIGAASLVGLGALRRFRKSRKA